MRQKQKKQQLQTATHELLQALSQYRTQKSMINKETMEVQEKCFLNQILTNQLHKIDIELLNLHDYLEQNGLDCVKDVVDLLFQIVRGAKNQQKKQKSYDAIETKQTIRAKSGQYCLECGVVVEKSKIIKIKSSMGITYGEAKNQQKLELEKMEKVQIKDQLSDDGFLEKFSLHITNIDFHLQELMKTMERQIISKTFAYLSKQTDQINIKELNFEQERQALQKNGQQIIEIQESKNKFTQNFLNKLKAPICEAILKVIKTVDQKKVQNTKALQKQQACQTLFTKQSQLVISLEQKMNQLNRELIRVKAGKAETDKEILNFLELQNRLKAENNKILIQKQVLEQRIAKQKHNNNKIEAKYFQELNSKIRQIEKLNKLINDQKSLSQRRNSIDRSKSSIGTIIQKKSSYLSIIEKQSSSNLKSFARPSVDLTIYQQEMMDMVNVSRFSDEKKNVGMRRNTKFWNRQTTKTAIKPEVNNTQDTRKMQLKLQQKLRMQKLQKLNIVSEIDVKIEGKKLTENELQKIVEAKILESKNKKLKNVRVVKPHKENKNGLTASTFFQDNPRSQYISNDQSQKTYRGFNDQKIRLKTDVQEFSTQPSKTIQKFKSGFASVRSLKSRAKEPRQQRLQKMILNSPQLSAENLILFGGESSAQDYEKNTGIWPHLTITDKLAVDFQNAGYCLNIQKHFKNLQQSHPQVYNEYRLFLHYPAQVIQLKKKNQPYQHLQLPEGVKMKDVFVKIIRYHKILHKSCSHVTQFLYKIGYSQF